MPSSVDSLQGGILIAMGDLPNISWARSWQYLLILHVRNLALPSISIAGGLVIATKRKSLLWHFHFSQMKADQPPSASHVSLFEYCMLFAS
jgi:hypothetical protein